MDINTLRAVVTLVSLGCFLGIAAWAYSRSMLGRFDDAARLPFLDDDTRMALDQEARHG